MSQLKETIREFSELNQLIADGVKDASNEEEANAFKAAGLNLVIGEAIKLVPGGYVGKFVVDKALETAGGELADKVLSAEEKERVKGRSQHLGGGPADLGPGSRGGDGVSGATHSQVPGPPR
jgi:hypothetical protein